MKKNWLLIGGIALVLGAVVFIVYSSTTNQSKVTALRRTAATEHNHTANQSGIKKIPAYQVAPTRASLRPTLEPESFTGVTRDAYRAVRQIPRGRHRESHR